MGVNKCLEVSKINKMSKTNFYDTIYSVICFRTIIKGPSSWEVWIEDKTSHSLSSQRCIWTACFESAYSVTKTEAFTEHLPILPMVWPRPFNPVQSVWLIEWSGWFGMSSQLNQRNIMHDFSELNLKYDQNGPLKISNVYITYVFKSF